MCFKNNGLKAQPAAPPSLLVALLAEAPAAIVALSVQHAPQPWKEYRRILLPTNREVHVWCLTCVSHSSERSQGWKIPYIGSYRNSCLGSMNNGNALQDSTQWHQYTCSYMFRMSNPVISYPIHYGVGRWQTRHQVLRSTKSQNAQQHTQLKRKETVKPL